jgi:hypothetical protein
MTYFAVQWKTPWVARLWYSTAVHFGSARACFAEIEPAAAPLPAGERYRTLHRPVMIKRHRNLL